MSSLLPPSATAEEKAIEASTARLAEVPVPIRETWNPDTCPENLLPWLAWALSVDNWDSLWSVDIKRAVIRESVMVHRKKGTRGAVERALRSLGVRIELQEWFEVAPGGLPPHTFQLLLWVNANLAPSGKAVLGPELYRALNRMIVGVKPVRSHYHIRVGAAFDDRLGCCPIITAAQLCWQEVQTRTEAISSLCGLTAAALVRTLEVARTRMGAKAVTDFNTAMPFAAVGRSAVLTQTIMEAR